MEFFYKILMAMFFVMSAVVMYRVLVELSRTKGLLVLAADSQVNPERLLVLVVAMGSALTYGVMGVQELLAVSKVALPEVPDTLLVAFAASQGIYLGGKGYRLRKLRQQAKSTDKGA